MEVLLKQVVSSRPTSIGLFDDVVQGHKKHGRGSGAILGDLAEAFFVNECPNFDVFE